MVADHLPRSTAVQHPKFPWKSTPIHLLYRREPRLAGRVHDLRGVYVWLAYLTRDWGDAWVAHVACEILGHSDIAETNVYTPFLVSLTPSGAIGETSNRT